MKNKTKIFVIFAIILIVIMLIPIKSYCADDAVDKIISEMKDANEIKTSGNELTKGINKIFSLVRYVGGGVSVIVMMSLGIKYMVASIEEKAEIKKRAVPIVIGCVIIFATTNLLVIISKVVDGFKSP